MTQKKAGPRNRPVVQAESPAQPVYYAPMAVAFFVGAVLLRGMLCWANPPGNAFDNHYEPIFLIIKSGAIPAKDACWQCYHPPVFYWVSAMAGKLAFAAGATLPQVLKLLQLVSCAYGILTVGVTYLILRRLPLSAFSRLVAFGAMCFLPRHIYMSAMNSNDTIGYLFVSLTIYLLLVAIERKLSLWLLLAVSVAASIAVFTKYTSYVVVPAILMAFATMFVTQAVASRRRVAASCILVLLLPGICLGMYWASNDARYGNPMPWNVNRLDPGRVQPRDSSTLDFLSFKPWESIGTPMLVPGRMHSAWTMVYSGMWYHNEPKYLYFLDSNLGWWGRYYAWLSGRGAFPGENDSLSGFATATGAGLRTLGLVPLALIIVGIYAALSGRWKALTGAEGPAIAGMSMFPVLALSNAAVMVALGVRLPVFTAVKASYFLAATPAFAVFMSLGVMSIEKRAAIRPAILAFSCLLFALVSVHVVHLVLAIQRAPDLFAGFGAGLLS